jgi:protein involved in polysaccharide export with SLBB domain
MGNLNFSFQNGDTVFVPLVRNQVRLEGGFTRVASTVPEKGLDPDLVGDTEEERQTRRLISQLQDQLGETPERRRRKLDSSRQGADGESPGKLDETTPALLEPAMAIDPRTLARGGQGQEKFAPEYMPGAVAGGKPGKPFSPAERTDLEDYLDSLKKHLRELKFNNRGDQRVGRDGADRPEELAGQPTWLSQWLLKGKAPAMQFEMLPGETVKDALGFAGGFALNAFSGSLTLQRVAPDGAITAVDVAAGEAMAQCVVQRGDVLTALPLRDYKDGAVTVGGWARVQGLFARKEGQGVGDLLKSLSLVLPDTYMERGELVRTLPDGTRRYQSFDLTKALAGDEASNLRLENRDDIELYRISDLRQSQTLTVLGPVSRSGTFEYLQGMRAADLLFRAGVPLKRADQYVAELAHVSEGKGVGVQRLDLNRLLSREGASPVELQDDRVNPRLLPFDQISIYAKPDYHLHRSVVLGGQVIRPGTYELENAKTSLRDVLARAGGLTAEAMPSGGIFLRSLGGVDPEKSRANIRAGIADSDPTSNGVNEILGRLNETKRNPVTGALIEIPLLHRLSSGALNRMVVDLPGILAGDPSAEVELQDGDEIIIPRKTEVAYVVGETASPFASFKVNSGMKVKDILNLAGGVTRNADVAHIRLLKADGRIVDNWVKGKTVEPGDAVLVPQRVRRDVSWQENLTALTPLAVMINALRN